MALEEDSCDHSDDERAQFIISSKNAAEIMSSQQQCNNRESSGATMEAENNQVNKETSRKSSIVSNAHLQLQILVEDVKGELKAVANNCSLNNNKIVITKKKVSISDEDPEIVEHKSGRGSCSGREDVVLVGWKRYLGILMAISSSMVFALCILIVKSLPQYHPFSVSFWRFQGVLIPSIPMAIYFRCVKKQKIFDLICPLNAPGHPKTVFLILLRGLTGAGAVSLQFYSLQYINMADSSVITFSTPVFVTLASHFILREKSGIIPVLCGVLTLFGVVVIARPPMLTGGEEFDTDTLIGAGMALGAMSLAAATFILLRYLRHIHFSVITMYFGFYGSFQSLALSATIGKFQPPEEFDHWMMAVALAVLTFLGQTLITLAFKYEQAGTISLCRTFDIVFAYLWQFIFLGVVPDMFSIIGGAVVIFGVLLAAIRKFISDLPADHPSRMRLWFLLK